nr:MAG TPA: hypothetical protein [Caudoviricetes sp.]
MILAGRSKICLGGCPAGASGKPPLIGPHSVRVAAARAPRR